MKYLLSLILILVLSIPGRAQLDTKSQADSAYAREDYRTALALYHKAKPSAAVMYNMGNCYYRLDSIARAILCYERARMLSPGNEDIQYNLTMVRSKTTDKLVPHYEFFFIAWYKAATHWMSVDSWAIFAIVCFVFSLISFIIYLFSPLGKVRSWGMGFGIAFVFLCALSNLFAYSQRYAMEHRTTAVIMTNICSVKSTPSSTGKTLFELHEGTCVEVTDDTLPGWYEIELLNGKKGWAQTSALEII